jgi:RimJ/RimL family protein N-acetyltransferase
VTSTTVHIPTLATERLTLRAPRLADFEGYAGMVMSDRAKHMEQGVDRQRAWSWFLSDTGHWTLFGFGGLMVDLGKTGETIGLVIVSKGLRYPEPELGWLLYDGAEGKGYATEAASALRDWIKPKVANLVSYISPGNAASIALAERLGAHHDPTARLPDGETDADCLVYRHWGRP